MKRFNPPKPLSRKGDPLWQAFMAMCDAAEDGDFEWTCEEFAAFYAVYLKLQRAGIPFDPDFCRRMEDIGLGLRHTPADGDADDADEALEWDLSEDDRGTGHEPWKDEPLADVSARFNLSDQGLADAYVFARRHGGFAHPEDHEVDAADLRDDPDEDGSDVDDCATQGSNGDADLNAAFQMLSPAEQRALHERRNANARNPRADYDDSIVADLVRRGRGHPYKR